MIKGRNIIAYLACKYKGNWEDIYSAIKRKEPLSEQSVDETVKNIKSNFVTIIDEDYPPCFKNIYQPPFCIFYYGDISIANNNVKRLGVIGSRDMSDYGKKCIDKLLSGLDKSMTIVSGLAKGIDARAHELSLMHDTKTIAVLGTGIDRCYPVENIELYEEIKTHHLLLSEYPSFEAPAHEHFPMRNRLIAALCDALLVVEAKTRSGSIITANHAIQQGKDVMCPPYHIDEESSCNKLIKDGAFLVENFNDVIDIIFAKGQNTNNVC